MSINKWLKLSAEINSSKRKCEYSGNYLKMLVLVGIFHAVAASVRGQNPKRYEKLR